MLAVNGPVRPIIVVLLATFQISARIRRFEEVKFILTVPRSSTGKILKGLIR